MATVNTASVREEITCVEQEIARLSEIGKVSDESGMLFHILLIIVNMLVAIFMERSTKKTSKNSSIPPSQITEDQSSKIFGSNKEGPAQNDESFDNSRTVETETVARVNHCSACGENLSQVSVTDYERRTRIDGAAQAPCLKSAWSVSKPRSNTARVVITSPKASSLPIWRVPSSMA